ncbi:MAG: 50S ribosomal protein L4 [Coriobacteriia bacterium]|nr:50S ribosomal protein L4 [Coriobacteriia bacterium]
MTSLKTFDMAGAKKTAVKGNPDIYGIEPNTYAMHTVVRSQLAAQRSGTHSTKTRGMVRGGGAKPWRQKGTGRARQGTIRAPQWSGGGVVFGPSPRSYAFKVPNKVVKLAMRSALSAKVADEQLIVVNKFDFKKPSAKAGAKMLSELGLEGKKVTVVVGNEDDNAYLSLRNIDRVRVIFAFEVNTYDLIDNKMLVLCKEAVTFIEEVLG